MSCILNRILPFLLNGFYLHVLHVCVYELAVGVGMMDIDDEWALEAARQYLKQIIVQMKPTEEQMRRGKHSCVMANW